MFVVAFKACPECSQIEQMTVKWMDAHSQTPAWQLPAQVLEVGSTWQVCAAQSAGAAHSCHLNCAMLLLIVPVIPIPGLPENLKPLKTLVREMLIFIKHLFFSEVYKYCLFNILFLFS